MLSKQLQRMLEQIIAFIIRETGFCLMILLMFFSTFTLSSQNAYFNLGRTYATVGNYKEAIRLTKLSLECDLKKTDKTDLFFDYYYLCEYNSFELNIDSCQYYANEVLNLYKDIDGIKYEAVLSNLSHCLFRVGLPQEAIDYRNEIINIYSTNFGSEYPLLVNQYCILSDLYKTSGNYSEAVTFAKKAESLAYQLRNKELLDQQISYDDCVSNLWYIIQFCDEPHSGVLYLVDILTYHRDAIKDEIKKQVLRSIWAISNDNDIIEGRIAVYKEYALFGNYYENLSGLIGLESEDCNIKYDVHAADYAQSLYSLAMSANLSQWFSEDEIQGILILLNRYYRKIGLWRHSFEIAKINYEWCKDNNLDLLYKDLIVLTSASTLPEEALFTITFGEGILETHRYDNDEESLNNIYKSIAGACLRLGENDKAQIYLKKISDQDDFETLSSIADVYVQGGDLKSLFSIALKLLDIKDLTMSQREYALSLIMISSRDNKDYDILTNYSNEYIKIYREELLANFPLLNEKEQMIFLQKNDIANNLTYDFLFVINGDKIEWAAPEAAYDFTLLKKGVLLTSQQEFRWVMINSPEENIRLKWKNLQTDKNNSIVKTEVIKRELLNYASLNSNYLNKLSYTWENIRDALKEDEVAIEYIMCYNFNDFTNKICDPTYLALLIFYDSEKPLPIVLSPTFNPSLDNPSELLDINNPLIYNLLWRPLEPYLNNTKTIYFSPTEHLHSLPMEYASDGNQRVCDKWNVIRVSSTREILNLTPNKGNEKAILYGGLCYDMEIDDLIEVKRELEYDSRPPKRDIYDENLRYRVKYLAGTLTEVQEVSRLFNISPEVKTGIYGTEESFKALDGSSYDILHLATHGFFWNGKEAVNNSDIRFIRDEDTNNLIKEELAMHRSGLVLSGASVILKGDELPDYMEDGILTAQEISSLNLSNIDMVVLSACDTGLGEYSEEGVFGLQRGFKLSGINTLLMSLWKVDDYATSILMVEFYKNYLSGKSKRDSLQLAQLALRNSTEFFAPYYWASFILLDGLN